MHALEMLGTERQSGNSEELWPMYEGLWLMIHRSCG